MRLRPFYGAGAAMVAILSAGLGCERSGRHDGHDHAADAAGASRGGHEAHAEEHAAESAEGHVHAAPHGGVLSAVGDHAAQLELLVEPAAQRVRLFVLDGCAEAPIRVSHPTLEVRWSAEDGAAQVLTLQAVESALTGERVGDTSEFRGDLPAGFADKAVTAVVPEITIRGVRFEDVALEMPASPSGD